MVVSEALTAVRYDLADVPGGFALSEAAGWNQTACDWRFFIRQGHTIGYRDSASRLVASAAALPYAGGKGWISMVLVAPAWRSQGLATSLLQQGIAHLQRMSLVPLLDATPAGVPVYLRLGFEAGFALARWQGTVGANAPAVMHAVRPAQAGDIQSMAVLDREANGCDRQQLLQDFLSRDASRAWVMRDGSGFVIMRSGRCATQVGPLVAADETSALLLLNAALGGASGQVFLDLPERWASLAGSLVQRGFSRQRPFVRMALGGDGTVAANDHLFVLAGPEFG